MKRREFTRVMGAALAGLGAGLSASARLTAGEEWDADIPPLEEEVTEARRAHEYRQTAAATGTHG